MVARTTGWCSRRTQHVILLYYIHAPRSQSKYISKRGEQLQTDRKYSQISFHLWLGIGAEFFVSDPFSFLSTSFRFLFSPFVSVSLCVFSSRIL